MPLKNSRLARVAPLVFCSGLCALIYQMAWLREFRLFFGASTAANAAVLGIFMGGLGFGSMILGPRSEGKDRPLAFYGKLELLIALSAAVTPALIWLIRHIYLAVGGTLALGLAFGTVVRLLLSALVLGLPTFFMGGTLPALARAVVGPEDVNRRPVALLYGLNTLGAVAGTCVATFYLFETWGNSLTIELAAVLNVAIAALALSFARRLPPLQSPKAKTPRANQTSQPVRAPVLFTYLASAGAGFAFLLMEIVWYRMLAPLLGGSTFTFGLILAVALFGIGLGGLIYATWFGGRKITLSLFAFVCALEGLCVAVPYALGDRVALVTMLIRPLGVIGFSGFVTGWTLICAIVVLPAAIVSGIQFPMLIALLGQGQEKVGAHTGMAYAWNTLGAIAGSLAGGFGFLPVFSATGVWRMVVILLGVLAVTAAALDLRTPKLWRPVPALVTALLAFLMLGATGPTAFWRHSQIGVGRLSKLSGSRSEFHDLMNVIRRETIWEKDGVESSVALSTKGNLNFLVNGKCDGGLKDDAGTQVMSGLTIAVLHPNPRRALVVGLGTGSSAGWLAAVPSLEKVDVFELEPAMLHVAQQCQPMNHQMLDNPKVQVVIGDARELLLAGHDRYDLIFSEPSNPYRAGIASLFTREYYQAVAQRLNEGGLFAQWVQAYEIDDGTIQSVYATLGSVFPNVDTWQTESGDLLLVATPIARSYDADALRRRIAQEPFQTALRNAWRVNTLEGFLAHFIADDSVTRRLQNLDRDHLNTDDRTVLEFAFARNVDLQNGFHLSAFRLMASLAHADRLPVSTGEVNWNQTTLARMSMLLADGEMPDPAQYAAQSLQTRMAAYASYLKGDLAGALFNWRKESRQPNDLNELLMLTECSAQEAGPETDSYIEKLRESLPFEADVIQANLLWRRGKLQEAATLAIAQLRRLHQDPWLGGEVTKRFLALAMEMVDHATDNATILPMYEALEKPFLAYNNQELRLVDLLHCGIKLDQGKPGKYCLPPVEAAEPHIPWQPRFLQIRADCYKAVNDPRRAEAERDLQSYVADQPLRIDAVHSQERPATVEHPGGSASR
jgi:spermidine synthase